MVIGADISHRLDHSTVGGDTNRQIYFKFIAVATAIWKFKGNHLRNFFKK